MDFFADFQWNMLKDPIDINNCNWNLVVLFLLLIVIHSMQGLTATMETFYRQRIPEFSHARNETLQSKNHAIYQNNK